MYVCSIDDSTVLSYLGLVHSVKQIERDNLQDFSNAGIFVILIFSDNYFPSVMKQHLVSPPEV